MTAPPDVDRYLRGAETLVASWEAYARGAAGASVQRFAGVAAAVFPSEPERAVYNNALLERELAAAERADALAAIEAAYAAAVVTRFASCGDCGIYNRGTLEHARRRGLGTVVTALHLHDALARGCRTASLQSTEMAERVYAAVGFRDLGRILEYAPPA